MAILYGTTGSGETLPVEVNEFGQLVAEGLPGQPGPPGPPGLPELPPNPFEGAILGWKDNTLSWLGGSVPIPPGVFGPILSYADGVLTLEDEPTFPYLTSLFLANSDGSVATYSAASSPIVSITPYGRCIYMAGSPGGTQGGVWDQAKWSTVFSGNPDAVLGFPKDSPPKEEHVHKWYFSNDFSLKVGDVLEVVGETDGNSYMFANLYQGEDVYAGAGPKTITQVCALNAMESYWKPYEWGYMNGIKLNGKWLTECPSPLKLSFNNADGLNEFRVGDEVKPGVFVVGVGNTTNPSDPDYACLIVDGGAWTVNERVFSQDKGGIGSVQSCLNNLIILREDNTEWKPGLYVASSDQNIAARYVYTSTKRFSDRIA